MTRLASIQTDPRLGSTAENLRVIRAKVRETEADLVVFPECALQGYGFDSLAEGLAVAEEIPGPSTRAIVEDCERTGRHVVLGLIERSGQRAFNSAVLMGPRGVVGVYRKIHIPFIGIDRFVTPGDLGFPVFTTPFGRLGIVICYDLSFPEAARSLKLDGAQLLIVSTNWPLAAEVSCVHAPPVRAQENHIHVLTCDRVGEEAGFRFRGGSKIVDCDGRTHAEASDSEATIMADLDLSLSDRNRVIFQAGAYEIDRMAHRRPSLYGTLTRPQIPS